MANLLCYRCGQDLANLTLPLSRRDVCPACGVELHACKQCLNFDRSVPRQCREDGAEDVSDKVRSNFCDWFKPSTAAFDASAKTEADNAELALRALFADDTDA